MNIENDIMYLLQELGHNIKINGIPSTAIVNNADRSSGINFNFDDKKIISKDKLETGDIIDYAEQKFIVISQIADKRYNTYYKALIRTLNKKIKFISDGVLYVVSCFATNYNSNIDGVVVPTEANRMILTVADTEINRKFGLNKRLIKFGVAWKCEGVDMTEKGLLKYHMESCAIDPNRDDLENAIADRWDSNGNDLLEETPIEPTEPEEPEPTPDPEPVEPEPEPTEPEEPSVYEIVISKNISENFIYQNETVVLSVQILKNGVEVVKDFTATANNMFILQNVSENEITAKGDQIGDGVITVSLVDYPDVAASMELEVKNEWGDWGW